MSDDDENALQFVKDCLLNAQLIIRRGEEAKQPAIDILDAIRGELEEALNAIPLEAD